MPAGDPHFANVSLLLHGEGADGSVTFVDNSPSPKLITAVGDAAISTAQPMFGESAMYFGGAGYLADTVRRADYSFGTGDFCLEAHVFLPAGAEGILFCLRDADNGIFNNMTRLAGGKLGWSDGVAWRETSMTVPEDVRVHLAVCRAAGTLRLFVGGVIGYEAVNTVNLASNRPLQIGAFEAYGGNPVGGYFTGYMDDIRITKGVARYTANFTPPTEAFPDSDDSYFVISGTVAGSTGAAAARLIRVQREDTGACIGGVISDVATGAFSIGTPYAGEHTVVAYPASGEDLPALVHRGVVPT